MSDELISILFAMFALWLIALSTGMYWIYRHYQRLTKGVKEGNLIKVLEHVLKREKGNIENIKEIKKELSRIDRDMSFHLQKIGFVRYNPFEETGGDQSFSLSLLDRHSTGYIITGLHTRDRTRIYVKPINKGKSRFELSKDEQKAIKEATKKQ